MPNPLTWQNHIYRDDKSLVENNISMQRRWFCTRNCVSTVGRVFDSLPGNVLGPCGEDSLLDRVFDSLPGNVLGPCGEDSLLEDDHESKFTPSTLKLTKPHNHNHYSYIM
jgi:hypothetical protein